MTRNDFALYPRLSITVNESFLLCFNPMLQQGVAVWTRVGCSIAALLREEIGASAEVIERIQSVILDGRPVDDLESALVKDGSTLALSAAMPGLVGATLRRGGTYSAFRSAITYRETGETCAAGEGFVTIKVFNLLMADLGRDLLRRGVIVSGAEALRLCQEHSQDFREGCRQMTLDGRPVESGDLQAAARFSGEDKVFLSVSLG